MASTTATSLTDDVTLAYPEAVALTPINQSRNRSTPAAPSESIRRSLNGDDIGQNPDVSRRQSFIVIVCVTVITGISTLLAGVVTITTPTLAKDIGLSQNLLFWPASIFSLTCGCSLLLLGSVADVVGSNNMYIFGCALQSAFTLGCGLSQSGAQLILFRGLAGIASSMCLPSAVSIITNTFAPGKRRNIAFSAMGGGQPLGFAIGLTLGGVFADTVGWRWAFHLATILNTGILILAVFGLPKSPRGEIPFTWARLAHDIDWIGAIIASASLACLSYVLAALTGQVSDIHQPSTIALLSVGLALMPVFYLHASRQEKLGRVVIIPLNLWRNRVFSAVCLNVFITWGTFNATETMLTFVFQYVQKVSALESSIRFLPVPVAGTASNIVMGLIAHKVNADRPVLIGNVLSAISPLLMALINPKASYWAYCFPAMILNAIGADALFTVSNLVITSVFPKKTQSLAGGVFNTISQVGKTVGLATTALIASTVTANSNFVDKQSPEALLVGYKAAFWYCFALCGLTIFLNFWGMRNIGKVGKED